MSRSPLPRQVIYSSLRQRVARRRCGRTTPPRCFNSNRPSSDLVIGCTEPVALVWAQRSVGAPVALLDATEVAERFPWLKTDDIRLGSLGTGLGDGTRCGEGYFDPYLLTNALNKQARRLGVQQLQADVVRIETTGDSVSGVVVATAGGDEELIEAATVINCAGPWAGALAATHGLDVPIRPRRRYVYQVSCKDPRYQPSAQNPRCPLVVDPSGVYIRGDGDRCAFHSDQRAHHTN